MSTQATLQQPNEIYKDSYIAAVSEYQAEGLQNYTQLSINELQADFSRYVEGLKNEAKGVNLPEGYVAHSVFWLVDNGEYIGRVDIRHELNESLRKEGGHIGYDVRPSKRQRGYGSLALKLGLEKAKELGLGEVLITCDVANIGSNKIIKSNGGVLEKVERDSDKNHYVIKVG